MGYKWARRSCPHPVCTARANDRAPAAFAARACAPCVAITSSRQRTITLRSPQPSGARPARCPAPLLLHHRRARAGQLRLQLRTRRRALCRLLLRRGRAPHSPRLPPPPPAPPPGLRMCRAHTVAVRASTGSCGACVCVGRRARRRVTYLPVCDERLYTPLVLCGGRGAHRSSAHRRACGSLKYARNTSPAVGISKAFSGSGAPEAFGAPPPPRNIASARCWKAWMVCSSASPVGGTD